MTRIFIILACLVVSSPAWSQAPRTFREAKIVAKHQIYHDVNQHGDLYCGCSWTWVGESGGRMDLAGCGYQVRARKERAERMEWEHVMPASWFGRQRQCWQAGGRENCQKDPVFSAMEADLHNLYPSVGEVNGDRSDYALSVLPPAAPFSYGQCRTRVDFSTRTADPRPEARGLVARVHFYMSDRYGIRLSDQQQRVLMAWDRYYPPSAWEVERDRRIARITGVSNPFVTRVKVWGQTSKPAPSPSPSVPLPPHVRPRIEPPPPVAPDAPPAATAPVLGNRSSGIYHVRGICPGYEKIGQTNRVAFGSEAQAQAAGFRRAKNCQ